MELVRHLHSLLVGDEKLSNEAAKGPEVAVLTVRYEELLLRARTREQRIRELRYVPIFQGILSLCYSSLQSYFV